MDGRPRGARMIASGITWVGLFWLIVVLLAIRWVFTR
jgi:hypothetical protein